MLPNRSISFFVMKIPIVQLEIRKKFDIDIPIVNKRIYGVESAAPLFIDQIGSCNVENVGILCLDNTNKPINFSIVAIGTTKEVSVPISEVLKYALVSNSSKIIIGHNHPSGVLEITSFDVDMTKNIAFFTKAFGIELIDSIIVNDKDAVSIRENLDRVKE